MRGSNSMTLNDLERQNRGFMDFFGDFGLRDTLQERIAPKPIEIDMDKLGMKFSALNEISTVQVSIFTRESRMLRASLPSSGRPSVCLSVCLSVRPSIGHTRELYQNGAS